MYTGLGTCSYLCELVIIRVPALYSPRIVKPFIHYSQKGSEGKGHMSNHLFQGSLDKSFWICRLNTASAVLNGVTPF